jgi:hypothetical protein
MIGTRVKDLYLEKRMFIGEKDNRKLTISNLSKGHGVYFNNCHGCIFIIRNKISNLMLENCTNCVVKFQTIIAKVELLRCTKVELYCKYSTNMVQSDIVNGLEFYINKKRVMPRLHFSNVSCWDLYLNIRETGKRQLVHASMFPDQYLIKFNEDGTFERHVNSAEHFRPNWTHYAMAREAGMRIEPNV